MHWKKGLRLTATLVFASGTALLGQHNHNGSVPAVTTSPHAVVRNQVPNNQVSNQGPNLGGRPYPIRRDVPTPTGLIAPAAAYTGITPGALRPLGNHGGGREGRGSGAVYGGFYGMPYLPYLPYAETGPSSTFPGFSEQAEAIAAQSNAQMQDAMAQQLEQMNFEIRQLRDSQMQNAQAPNGAPVQQQPPWTPAPAASMADSQPQPQVPIVLVLRSGARVSVANYAIMNGNLWDFSKQPARKIPLSTVNVAASESATEQAGGEFPQLGAAPPSAQ